ncbi:MAG TPA: alkaline phosphatase D family protein [Candidatus Acidoferrales bacterium]|nr:alkaline phosphatase D family protein [Candidatus Acidoferrales bacterium]
MLPIRKRILFLTLALLLACGLAAIGQQGGKPLRRVVFGSCADQNEPQPIWNSILAAKPDIFLAIGDIVYVNDGWEKHSDRVAAYAKLSAIPGFARLRRAVPLLAIWDDGEFGANDGGGDFQRRDEFRADFLDFLGEPKDSPRRTRSGIYDAKVFGPQGMRVQIILLDMRFNRSALKRGNFSEDEGRYLPDPDPAKTMLGAEQWKWLESQLRLPAEIRLLVSSIQVIPEDHHWETWANLPLERQRLFQLICATDARGVLFLSGDRHLAELSMMDGGVGYPLFDLTSSGLNKAHHEKWRPQEPNRHRVATMNVGDNFGVVEIDWNPADPRISLQIRDVDGDITTQRKIPLSLLRPGAIRTAGQP